ncbi:MAG: aryl-sulfate sulfotransferase, partial [Bryobacteraceae bacterium]
MLLLLAAAFAPIQTFSIQELFGVTHPPQVIDFDFHKPIDPDRAYMIGPQGMPVPFQLLHDGKIAVEAALAANTSAEWKLYAAEAGRRPASFPSAVRIAETPAYYEIVNGLTGVRIARADRPFLAPIQGILYRDGTWTATGPNALEVAGKPTGMRVRFVERGPLKVVVEVSYSIDRPRLEYGDKTLLPAGPGFYRSTIEVQAGQPSILIEDDTDTDLRYTLDIYRGLQPDQARYRGHHSTSIENGREPDGRQYRPWNERPAGDAIRDLQYRTPAPSDYNSEPPHIRRMAVWDPWVYDSGWYWLLYNTQAAPDANLIGIFAGPASRAIGAAHNGAGIFTAPGPIAGIAFETHRRAPDAHVSPRVRIAWGIFVGSKGADLGDPYKVQNIARQMNLLGGINLNKVYRCPTEFADPPGAYQPLFMPRAAVDALIGRVRSGPDDYHRLYNDEPAARPLLDMWRDPSGAKLHELAAGIAATAHDLLDALVNGDGIYDFHYHYWHGGLEMTRQAVWINAVLTSDRATAADRAGVKAAAALFASVLWDPDFVPLFDGHGLNLGTANMPVQQNQYRDIYAALLGRDRHAVVTRALDNLHQTVNEAGAAMGSTHYIGASMGPLLTTLQQLQTAGLADAFRDEPRLSRFAEFYLNLLTPPEPRFGGYRKLVSIGDGSTESSELYGQLATGFAASDPALSARLMAAWRQSGAMHSGFHGSTILKIDEDLPVANPSLGDATFPGWYTVLRNGWGSRNETAVWLVDGDFYRDHAHEDNGTVAIYALGAPLSIDWGSMYYPSSPGAFMHSVALPENALPFPWDTTATPLDQIGFRWQHAAVGTFDSFPSSACVRATYESNGAVWTRSVYSIHPDESNPIIAIRDNIAGTHSARIVTLNLMAAPPALPSCTGQWLINWDLYAFTADPAQTVMRSWSHHWHPNREQNEFAKANRRPFEESQSIFRIRTTGASTLLLLPWRKDRPRDASVRNEGLRTTIAWNDSTTMIDPDCYTYNDTRSTIVTAFGATPCQSAGIAIAGGAAEVHIQPDRATITAHGAPGPRTISLPSSWGARRVIDYAGPQPKTVILHPVGRASRPARVLQNPLFFLPLLLLTLTAALATAQVRCPSPAAKVNFAPNKNSDANQGLIITSFFPSSQTENCIAITDLTGAPSWTYCAPGYLFMTHAVLGDTILFLSNTTSTNYAVNEMNLSGTILHSLTESAANIQLATLKQQPIIDFNHEAFRLPNGYTAVIAHNERLYTDIQGSTGTVDILGDEVLVLNTQWKIVWTWNAFDFLPVTRAAVLGETCTPCPEANLGKCCPITLAAQANDWLHGNSLTYDSTDGNLILSLRNQDWIVKIAYQNGAGDGHVIWTLGNGGNFTMVNTPQIPSPWFSHQHDVGIQATDNPKLLTLFDNGNTREATDPTAKSRGQVLSIDEPALTADIHFNANLPFYSAGYGTAQILENGNYWFQAGVVGG